MKGFPMGQGGSSLNPYATDHAREVQAWGGK